MEIAAAIFVLTALGGGGIALMRFSGKPYPPVWLAGGHGALAASGLAVLGYVVSTQSVPPAAYWALGMLVATAAGGLTLFLGFHLQNRALPLLLVMGHGLLAIASLIVLLVAAFGS